MSAELELHTYSIVARDPETGQLGVAVQTHQMCVGSIVPWLEPGVGAVATQARANIAFGPLGLALLREGTPAPQVIAALAAADPQAHRRQVAVVDAQGRAAAWTGEGCIAHAAHHTGAGYSVQANMMDRDTVVPAMAAAYEGATGDLAARMMAALRAAQGQGGDIRGMQSAALKVVGGAPVATQGVMAIYDLRVDEAEDPLLVLERLVRLRRAQWADREGYRLAADDRCTVNDRHAALAAWAGARAMAPELEELAFWQAIHLADACGDIDAAAEILGQMLAADARRTYWIDLIRRLQACGIVERPGAGAALIAALEG